MRRLALSLLLAGGFAPGAKAGLLINPNGIFLTAPEVPAFVRTADGHAYFGGPATGFRQFGESGFSPVPYDPGLYRNGINAYGPTGFEFHPMPHGEIEFEITDDTFFGLLDGSN